MTRAKRQALARLGASLLVIGLLAGCVSVDTSPTERPSPESTPSPSSPPVSIAPPTLTPSPTPRPLADLAWHTIGTIASPSLREIVGFAGGYVAIDQTITVWFSSDGASWRAIKLPFTVTRDRRGGKLLADVQAVATDGRRVLVVGGYAHEPCDFPPPQSAGGGPPCPLAPLAWISDDGRTWTSAYPGPQPVDPPGYEQGSEFVAAWPVPTGGWDAAVSYWAGESLHGRDLMHSVDGLTWTALMPAPQAVTGDADPFPWAHAGVADQHGRRLLWQQWTSYTEPLASGGGRPLVTVSMSPDGETWTPMDGFPGSGTLVTVSLAPTADPATPWIVAGASGTDDWPSLPTVWTSPDASAWTAGILPTADASPVQSVDALVRGSVGYVAVGAVRYGDELGQETWLSHDGSTWTRLARPSGSGVDLGPSSVADGPVGIIGIGLSPVDREHESGVSQLR